MSPIEYTERLKLAIAFRRTGRLSEAREECSTLIDAHPERAEAWHCKGQCYTDLGRFHVARAAHRYAFELVDPVLQDERKLKALKPNELEHFKDIVLGYACALLRSGEWAQAWPLWEFGRLGVSWSPMPMSLYLAPGDPIPEKLLLTCEGGYGDFFMFRRWIPLLKSQLGVKEVGLMLWKPLLSLFGAAPPLGVDVLYTIGEDVIPFGRWPYQTSIMGLPAIFGVARPDDVPSSGKRGPRPGVAQSSPLRIGFCWRAEENTSPRRVKSLPVSQAESVIHQVQQSAQRSVEFYSLSPAGKDLYNDGAFSTPANLAYEGERMETWQATADYLLSMDFVLSVDTAVAHLAGLRGVPCLLLLPAASCWRWGLERSSGPWYGEHLTYYRESDPVCWWTDKIARRVIERIEA